MNNLYLKTTNKNGKVFKVVYRLGELYEKTKIKSPVYRFNQINKKKLYQYIKKNEYEYVVTTHLFAAQALTAIKKEHEIHFMQVATDYVSIPFWEETNPDFFVIPSKDLEMDFQAKYKKKQVKLLPFGIPVAKSYTQQYSIEESKNKLNLDVNQRYVLLLTGSMGFGNVMQMVEELEKNIPEVQFIVSCGNNEKLRKDLEEKYGNKKNVISLPFTKNLSQYMKSSEIILSKPGGLTTTEIATLRKPFIHTMPIPGCENYNADFFSKRKMSIQGHSIKEVVEKTKDLLENKQLQQEMIENQKQYINQEATNQIANVILREVRK